MENVQESDGDTSPTIAKKMKTFDYNNESFPITVLDDINQIIDNPPEWIERILSLKKRSDTVCPNVINDCHVDVKNFRPQKRLDRRCVPKTLVCHDYKGGYLEDRFLSSCNIGNLYSFYHWNYIDIFVYFSHYLITIPPLCWINTAHKNGCKILGTLITEFDVGQKICEKIFKDEDTMRIFATSLVQITKIFNFDGWLLNIENALLKNNTELLKRFVSYLTIKIHELNPDHLIIWYDSVIETGELKWQNELNINNKYFFDNCDGIFLNYVWNLENIKRTCDYAKHRLNDVYVGIDVFGRNTYGGGNFNCYKAAQIIRRYHLSMAIFAPGWTHETLLKKVPNDQEFFEIFINRDCTFWNSLWPYLYTHPIQDYFRTSFFTGTNQAVYNIFAQHQQLSKIKHPTQLPDDIINGNYKDIPTLTNKCKCLQCYYPVKGVRCLITKEFLNKSDCYVHRLFLCDLILNGQIVLFYIIKTNKLPIKLTIKLLTINRNSTIRTINCLNYNKDDPINNSTKLEILPTDNQQIHNYVKQNYEYLLNDDTDLSIYCYQFDVNECNLLEIGAIINDDNNNSVILCAFGIEKDIIL